MNVFPTFSYCAIILCICCALIKNDVKAAHASAHRMVAAEDAEEVSLPMINDTNVTLLANITAENVTAAQEEDENEDFESEDATNTNIADNSTDSSNATVPVPLTANTSLAATYLPSSSPTINSETTEMPTKLSTHVPTISPSKQGVTVSPTSAITTPIDVSLNIQPINIVILTDVHSWVQGHGRHEPELNADYGHILSFYQRLREQSQQLESKPDVYLVNNGDFLHGTILGDDPPEHLMGILERMPFDAINLGEHDISNSKSLEKLQEAGGIFDEWGERLVTSNVRQSGVDEGKLESVGNNYLFLEGNQGTVLVLAFLYNLNDYESADEIMVVDVEDVIKEDWFTSLFASCKHTPGFDAVVVLSHMDVQDEIVTLLLSKFRELCGQSMVVQFITGHTHIRSFVELDTHSSSIEAGRYLDTVGFVSFDPKRGDFKHNFIPANEMYLAQSLNMTVDEYSTNDGKDLSEYITRTIEHAGGNHILGCASRYFNETELLELYLNEVLPKTFLDHYHSSRNILLQYLEFFVGYDLFPGVITMGDIYTVIPQDYTIDLLGSMEGSDVTRLMKEMSKNDRRFFENSTDMVGLSTETESGKSIVIEDNLRYNLHILSKDASAITSILSDLGIKSSLRVSSKDKTIRDVWIDYVQKNMPYDDNNCKCIDETNGCSSSGDASKIPSKDHHVSPQPQPTHPTHPASNHSTPIGSNHDNTNHVPKSTSLGKSKDSSNSTSSSSSMTWVIVVIAGGIIFFAIRSGRRAATPPEVGNDLELQISPPPGYGDVSGGAGGYASPHLGRYV